METLYQRYPALEKEKDSIERVINLLIRIYEAGNKLLLCGNGGSAADCDHIVGELMKGFLKKRPVGGELAQRLTLLGASGLEMHLQGSLPAISLGNSTALISAFANDVDPEFVFAQQVMGLGNPGDVIIGISTSGNAANVRNAILLAKAKGLYTVGLTGAIGGWLAENCDMTIRVPEMETYKIQELHLPVYHWICANVEEHFYQK